MENNLEFNITILKPIREQYKKYSGHRYDPMIKRQFGGRLTIEKSLEKKELLSYNNIRKDGIYIIDFD